MHRAVTVAEPVLAAVENRLVQIIFRQLDSLRQRIFQCQI